MYTIPTANCVMHSSVAMRYSDCLHMAIQCHDLHTAKCVLALGANPNAICHPPAYLECEGWTLMHEASTKGDGTILQALMDAGGDVNAETSSGWTPLHALVNVQRKLLQDKLGSYDGIVSISCPQRLNRAKILTSSMIIDLEVLASFEDRMETAEEAARHCKLIDVAAVIAAARGVL